MTPFSLLRRIFARNKVLIAIISAAFFVIVAISAVVAYFAIFASPALVEALREILASTRQYVAIPPPYTRDLFRFIFLNNVGHFWNPLRIWVWIPFVGAFSLGYELLLNAVVIGGVISYATVTRGPLYAIAGLTPHGVIEIPAFILEFSALARWHLSTSRAIYSKISGRPVDRPVLKDGLVDTLVLSLISVGLFAAAAYVESYVTPRLLGL